MSDHLKAGAILLAIAAIIAIPIFLPIEWLDALLPYVLGFGAVAALVGAHLFIVDILRDTR